MSIDIELSRLDIGKLLLNGELDCPDSDIHISYIFDTKCENCGRTIEGEISECVHCKDE